jgi:hypothetical protein
MLIKKNFVNVAECGPYIKIRKRQEDKGSENNEPGI